MRLSEQFKILIEDNIVIPKLKKGQLKAISKKVKDKIDNKFKPDENERTGVFKEKYNDWNIFWSNNTDREETTHIDSIRLNRGEEPITETDINELVKKALDELDGKIQNSDNSEAVRIYKILRDKNKNGFVKVTIKNKEFGVKISMSTNIDDILGKRTLVHTVQNIKWYDNGMITLKEQEVAEVVLIF